MIPFYKRGILCRGYQEEQKKSQEVRGGMIDIEHAKQEFENYLDEYDRQDEQIYLKIEHTYGVVKYAGGDRQGGWSVPGKMWNLQS